MPQLIIEPVRAVTIPYASAFGAELHAMGSLSHVPFEPEYNRAVIASKINDPSWWMRLARTVDNDAYCGIMVGYVSPFVFSQRLWGHEELLYVREGTKYRGAIALNLVTKFVEWCYDRGAVVVHTGDIAAINSMAVDALYRHAGFYRAGSIYEHRRG